MTVAEYTFKRNYQVITLATKSAIKIDGITVQIDPQLLFQGLILAAKTTDNIKDVFKYELCSYPPALFDTSLLLREPQKPMLANAIWNLLTQDTPEGQVCARWWFPSPAHSMETRGHLWRYMYSVHRLCSKEVWGSNSCF